MKLSELISPQNLDKKVTLPYSDRYPRKMPNHFTAILRADKKGNYYLDFGDSVRRYVNIHTARKYSISDEWDIFQPPHVQKSFWFSLVKYIKTLWPKFS